MPRIHPMLWFDTEAESAANFYVSIFPNSQITDRTYYGPENPDRAGQVMTVAVSLDGHEYEMLNGGPHFTHSEALSLVVDCADQAEVDYYWSALSADGGSEGPCGWLKDQFGVSWQVEPVALRDLVFGQDIEAATRARNAMYQMKKLDIAAIERAYKGQ